MQNLDAGRSDPSVQYPTLSLKVLANLSWLIYDALIVRRIFSTVRSSPLVEIDSVVIATTVSNLGKQYSAILCQPIASGIDPIYHATHALTAICNMHMHPARRRP